MNIDIKISASDSLVVDSFCRSTGYSDKLGIAKADWISMKVSDFLLRSSRQGKVIADISSQKQTLADAMRRSSIDAVTQIPDTSVTVTAAPAISGVDVITKP